MDYRQKRRIARQWAKGEALNVLFKQHELDHNSFAALVREVGDREPAILLPVLTSEWAELHEK